MLCQAVWAAFSVPVTGSPAVVTVTLLSLPRAAVTVMPWPGCAFLLPLAGVKDSCTPEDAACPAELPELPVPPPEQAVVTRPSTPQIAAMTSQRRWRAGEGWSFPATSGPPTANL